MNSKTKILISCLALILGFGAATLVKAALNFGETGGSVTKFNGVLHIKSSGTSFINNFSGFDIDISKMADTPLKGMLTAIGNKTGGQITLEQITEIATAIINSAMFNDSSSLLTALRKYGLTDNEIVNIYKDATVTDPTEMYKQGLDLLSQVNTKAGSASGTSLAGSTGSGEITYSDIRTKYPSTSKLAQMTDSQKSQIKESLISEAKSKGYTYKNGQLIDPSGNSANAANEYLSILEGKSTILSDDTSACVDAVTQGTTDSGSSGSGSGSSGGSGSGGVGTGTTDSSGSGSNASKTLVPKVTNDTAASQSSLNAILKVGTNLPADCQYNRDKTFTYGQGTGFDTTGGYIHSAEIKNAASQDYVFYVICRESDTHGISAALKVNFKVDLSQDPNNAPKITNTTTSPQIAKTSNLAVKTEKDATCQFKADRDFTYGATGTNGATQFTVDGSTLHTATVATPASKEYLFYVVCKDKATGAANAPGTSVSFMVDLDNASTVPAITSSTPASQSAEAATLSLTTNVDATCQYKEGADFTYGAGANGATQFTIDGSKDHRSSLGALSAGTHTFYVVCKNVSTGAVNGAGAQIVFVASSPATTCIQLSSNDRLNDAERSYSGTAAADSVFLWQAVETGERENFKKVNWHAGYQFTPQKNGQVVQLCGYFDEGVTNKISLYNGSYAELASARIAGTGEWKCAGISPVAITRDSRYYVMAKVENNPVYFEYKSGMLPRDANNAVIDAGVRQAGEKNFGVDIKKYDYMVFGLVDAKVRYDAAAAGPAIAYSGPSGTASGSSIKLYVQTAAPANCRFDRDDVGYDSMKYAFPQTAGKNFEQLVCGLTGGQFSFFARCADNGGEKNSSSAVIQFNVSN